MKIAALLLLEVFVLLCRSAVITNPKQLRDQLRDSSETHVDRRTIVQRAPPPVPTPDSPVSTFEAGDGEESPILPLKPGEVSGPADRRYDWDITCTSTDRQKVTDAYNMAIQLVKDSEAKLKALAAGLPKPATKDRQTVNQNWIAEQDPAYTQMFFALDNRIEDVRNVYQSMISGIESSPTDPNSKRRGAFLRFVCAPPDAKYRSGKPICDGVTEALTTNINNKELLEDQYAFADAASIIFCPPFFDDDKFPSTQVLEKDVKQHCSLDKVQSRDRIMIHEWAHLEWTADLNADVENYGYEKAAKTAGSGTLSATGNNRRPDWLTAKLNAESFAWYAIYHHWNELCPHVTAGNSCGDVWPQGGKAKDPTSLNFWKPAKPNPIRF